MEVPVPVTVEAEIVKADRPDRPAESVAGGPSPDTAGDIAPKSEPVRTIDRPPADAGRPAGPVEVAEPLQGPGWRTPAVVALAVLAFCLGAGATGAVWFTRPAPTPVTKTVTVAPALPSPYDQLHALPERSPLGVPVDVADAGAFLKRSRAGGSESESRFWRQWALRGLLQTRANGVAATLSDFATELARTRADPPTLAAARLLWEMAALADDCAASENVARALGTGGEPERADVPTWQKRARDCRAKANSGPH